MATQTPYDWIQEIQPESRVLDDVPLTGAAPPFPWNQLSSRLSESLERKIEITAGEISLRTKDQLFDGLGEKPFPLIISIPSLAGNAAWLMPEQEVTMLETLLLTKEKHPLIIQDTLLIQAFYRFLALEALYNVSQLKVDKSLVPILTTQTKIPIEDALCWDISIIVDESPLWGRLIIFEELRNSWVSHFSKQNQPSALTKKLAKKVETIVHLEVGKTSLSAKEWSEVRIGDWIALDQFFLDLDSLSGRVMLTINGKNIFVGRLKESNIKIVEFPLYSEAEVAMANKTDHDDDHTDHTQEDESMDMTEDFDLDETLNTDFTHESDHDSHASTTDHSISDDTTTDTTTHSSATHKPKEQPAQNEKKLNLSTGLDTKHITSRDIPVNLIVELGQLQITMEKLLLLEPGNILDLNIHPENGVDLIINGKRVGKAELVRLGESIGIRILELG